MMKDISHKVKTNMAKLFCRFFANELNCILELMPTLYGHITTVSFSLFIPCYVSKCEIRCQQA